MAPVAVGPAAAAPALDPSVTERVLSTSTPSKRPLLPLHPRQWRIPKRLTLSPYFSRSRNDRIEIQKAARGTTSGPAGQEVDAWVASTLTRKDGNAAARQLVDADPGSDGRGTFAQGGTTAAGASPSATGTDLVLDGVRVDENGRRLGLEDDEDPQLRDDPAVFVSVSSAAGRSTGAASSPVDEVVQAATADISPDLLAKVRAATFGRQTSIRSIPPPTSTSQSTLVAPAPDNGFVDPLVYGGTSFDLVGDGEHEPLNVIVSARSSPELLTRRGFQSYLRSLDFDRECLGLHSGTPQKAWTDPCGWRDEEWLFRMVYTPLDHVFGTCVESLLGGNHFRAWQQQGTGAWFLATSEEENVAKKHDVVPDGYNKGRDDLVKKSQGKKGTETSFLGKKYRTEAEYVYGLMPPGNQGVNHDIAVDGLTAVLTMTVQGGGEKTTAATPQSIEAEGVAAPLYSELPTDGHQPAPPSAPATLPTAEQPTASSAQPSRRATSINAKTKQLWRKIRHKSTSARPDASGTEASTTNERLPSDDATQSDDPHRSGETVSARVSTSAPTGLVAASWTWPHHPLQRFPSRTRMTIRY